MANFIGREISFGVGVEGVRGTAETVADRWVRKTTANVIPRNERVIDDTTFGRLEDAERVRTVRKWNEGDVEGIAHADVMGYFFTNLYGDVDSTLLGSSVYEHEFTLAQNITHPTLTLFMKDADVRNTRMAGGVVSQLEINAATDDYVRFSADFLAKEEASSTDTPTLETEYDWVSRDISLKLASAIGGLGAATPVKVKNLSITWNANAEADWVFGDYSPENIYNKEFSIEGTLTRNYTDQTFEDLYKSQDFRYVEMKMEGEANLGGANNPTLTLLGNKLQVTDWNRSSTANDLVTEDVSFKLFYNADDEQQSKVTLINLTDEYVTTTS
jgi:hypothetical protein